MRKLTLFSAALILISCFILHTGRAAGDKDDAASVAPLIAQGDQFFEKKQFEKAMERYKKADKDSHHDCVWGTWCPPCRASVPTLVNIHKKFSDRPFQIVGVSSDTDEDKWKTFIATNRMTWPEYIDLPGSLQALFEIHEFPTYIVLDRNGVIQMRQSGWDIEIGSQIEEAINKALKKPYNPEAPRGTATKGQN